MDLLDCVAYTLISWSKFRTAILNGVNCLFDAKRAKLLLQVMQLARTTEKKLGSVPLRIISVCRLFQQCSASVKGRCW